MNYLHDAIQVFEDKKTKYDEWYQSQPFMTLTNMVERQDLIKMCNFAIGELKKAQKQTEIKKSKLKIQKIAERRREKMLP